jgi:hypothetical protein
MSDHLPILTYLFDDSIAIKNQSYKITRNFNESNTHFNKKRKQLYKKLLSSPNPARESYYKKYRNKLNQRIRIAKRTYYDNRFNLAKTNLKETWKLINEVINKSKRKIPLSPTLTMGTKY